MLGFDKHRLFVKNITGQTDPLHLLGIHAYEELNEPEAFFRALPIRAENCSVPECGSDAGSPQCTCSFKECLAQYCSRESSGSAILLIDARGAELELELARLLVSDFGAVLYRVEQLCQLSIAKLYEAAQDDWSATEILSFSLMVQRCGWPSIVLTNPLDKSLAGELKKISYKLRRLQQELDLRIIGAQGNWEQRLACLLTFPMLARRPQHAIHRLSGRASQGKLNWNAFDTPPAEAIISEWLEEEFEDSEAIEAVRNLATAINGVSKTKREEETRLSIIHRILICLVTSRFMAKQSFESSDCDTNIVFAIGSAIGTFDDDGERSTFGAPLFQYNTDEERPTYCHLADSLFRDEDSELIQSGDSCLVVNLDDLRLNSIRPFKNQHSRYQALVDSSNRVGAGMFAVGLRPGGFVEVFSENKMVLWYDRFRWHSTPYGMLTKLLREVLCVPDSPGTQDLDKLHFFVDAISTLMDRQESSILAFLPSDHKDYIGELPLKPLREDMSDAVTVVKAGALPSRLSLVGTDIGNLSISSLVSLLHLDGAHVFCGSKLVRIAQNIVPNRNSSSKQHTHSKAPGTGNRAARELAAIMPTNSFVLKVSASGKLLLYRGTKVLPR